MELRIDDLKKTYGSVKALKGISYSFTPGVYGILGANGAGKSTMINLITDNVSRDKDGGSITYCDGYNTCGNSQEYNCNDNEKTISGEPLDILKLGAKFRGIVGYMPQQQGFYEDFSPKAFLKYMAEIKGVKAIKSVDDNGKVTVKKVGQQIDELLGIVNLTSVAYKKIGGFSGGMKQRVLLAQALLGNPKILILDEPTAGLDVAAREDVLDLLREYMEEKEERAILISSHISSDLEGLCDDLYMIHNGKIVLHEETDVLLGEYAVLKVDEEQYQTLDKQYILSRKKEAFGYQLLTNQKQFYLENYPKVVVENGTIDEAILMMIKGESV